MVLQRKNRSNKTLQQENKSQIQPKSPKLSLPTASYASTPISFIPFPTAPLIFYILLFTLLLAPLFIFLLLLLLPIATQSAALHYHSPLPLSIPPTLSLTLPPSLPHTRDYPFPTPYTFPRYPEPLSTPNSTPIRYVRHHLPYPPLPLAYLNFTLTYSLPLFLFLSFIVFLCFYRLSLRNTVHLM